MKTVLTDKEEVFIDLSKCSEEERKHIEKLTNYKYRDNFYSHLYFTGFQWMGCTSCHVLNNGKTELTYPEFIKLFDGGEGEADTYAELLKNADILLNMFTELASETMTKWEQHQIDAVQFISGKINSNQ